ncbi:MAG: 2-C-methyl-D-erythritol 4-phosphate cytidylyltransferase [Candidatus Dasytiphilus stammeri]
MDNNISQNITAIIPAAGLGRRMQSSCPKQYLTIGSKTILEHAISVLVEHPAIQHIIIVINCEDHWFELLPIVNNIRVSTTLGKMTRSQSVMAGLQAIHHPTDWILIHDAVRPCLDRQDVDQLLKITTNTSGGHCSPVGGILVNPVCDTIKCSREEQYIISHTIDRKNLWHALTPQLFPFKILYSCLLRVLELGIELTDDCSALEYCGYHPGLIVGHRNNIKVTYPEDLTIASVYLQEQQHKHEKIL